MYGRVCAAVGVRQGVWLASRLPPTCCGLLLLWWQIHEVLRFPNEQVPKVTFESGQMVIDKARWEVVLKGGACSYQYRILPLPGPTN